MRTSFIVLTFIFCLGVLGISIYITIGYREGQENPIREEEVMKGVPRSTDFSKTVRKNNGTLPATNPAPRPPEFFEEPTGTDSKSSEECRKEVLVEKPTIVLEEEVEITRSFPNFGQRQFESSSCIDAYGIGKPSVEP